MIESKEEVEYYLIVLESVLRHISMLGLRLHKNRVSE